MRLVVGILAGLLIGLLISRALSASGKPPCNVIEKSERSFLLDKKRECTDAERASKESK